MQWRYLLLLAGFILLELACDPDQGDGNAAASLPPEIFQVEDGEWLPGDEATNQFLLGPNSFLMPAENLTVKNDIAFYSGNGFFNQGWVEAPASTTARDGLGPFFNARSCSGCHARDGRAKPPEDGPGPFVGLLLRLSVPGSDGPKPLPSYGEQLQDQATPDVPVEGVPVVRWVESKGQFDDGTAYTLVRPIFSITQLGYGPLPDDVMISPRIAPQMIGLGLLEGLSAQRMSDLADPDDSDGDGISGKVQWHTIGGVKQPGRFGWKAEAPSVEMQVANALLGDMGLTSEILPNENCHSGQDECKKAPHGGEPEVDADTFLRMVIYSAAVGVPIRRAANDPVVLAGKVLFHQLGCASCHTPSHVTEDTPLEEFSGLLIWPYTDLLLHDMGDGLADGRPVGVASGREWKTPPLWGIGLTKAVSGHTRFLHDGRARNLTEAILWHGGEAAPSRDAFKALSKEERASLIKFVEDL